MTDTAIECLPDSVLECIDNTPLVKLNRLFPQPGVEVLAKLEFMNPGGSMKDRPARYIIEEGLADGSIHRGVHLVESSSGNFGIALAIAARVHGLTFTCVIDPKTTHANIAILRQLGVDVDIVDEPDDGGGYLQTRPPDYLFAAASNRGHLRGRLHRLRRGRDLQSPARTAEALPHRHNLSGSRGPLSRPRVRR